MQSTSVKGNKSKVYKYVCDFDNQNVVMSLHFDK